VKDWMRAQPWLAAALAGSLLAGLALGVWGSHREAENTRLRAQLDRETRAWNALARAPVAPTAANAAAAEAHLAALEGQSARLRAGLAARGSWDPTPAFRGAEELYFDLLGMVEEQRAAFAAAGIRCERAEQFGYGQVVRAQQVALGPEDPALAMTRLHRQRQALAATLDALRAAGPERLLGVERTPLMPLEAGQVARLDDHFLIASAVTAAVPGAIETYGLRVRFEGRTATLRDFLETVRAGRRPLVVRSIEVGPAGAGSGAGVGATTRGASPSMAPTSPFATLSTARRSEETARGEVPIVEANTSVFTVVLEGYALLEPGAAGANGEGALSE
jgi:hypothetical protein